MGRKIKANGARRRRGVGREEQYVHRGGEERGGAGWRRTTRGERVRVREKEGITEAADRGSA